MAGDTAALLSRLRLDKPDLAGYRPGRGVVLHAAAKYPGLAARLVVASAAVRHGVAGEGRSRPRSRATAGCT